MAATLVALFGVTGGAGGEALGSDEADAALVAWRCVRPQCGQVGEVHRLLVRPSDVELGERCRDETGLSPRDLERAPLFGDVIQQFQESVSRELQLEKDASFCLCVDGPLFLRQVCHPEASRKGVSLPHCFNSYYDLRKEFAKCCSTSQEINIWTMADALGVTRDADAEFGAAEAAAMSNIVLALAASPYDHKFSNPEEVLSQFESGNCHYNSVHGDTVVRVRGLPWQSSEQDIALFFKGLNIAKGGIALCLNPLGRRNGEALVMLQDEQQRDLALSRHKHHMGSRYIEVYRSSAEEFSKIAVGASSEVSQFLAREGQVIVRMRGLPFTAAPDDVLAFFGAACPVTAGRQGLLFVRHPDGRPTGDAFVLFAGEECAAAALAKHRHMLGKRYIELFRSTAAELQQVLNRVMSTPLLPVVPVLPSPFPGGPLCPSGPLTPGGPLTPSGAQRDCVRLRGLPYSASIEEILDFLGEFAGDIRPQGVHMVFNQQGRPSGDAFIQMRGAERAALAAQRCHRRSLRERYVEVFACSADEMSVVLLGGSLNSNGLSPPPCLSPPGMLTFPPQGPMFGPEAALFPHPMLLGPPRPPPCAPTGGFYQPATSTQLFMNYTAYYPSPPVSPSTMGFFSSPPGMALPPQPGAVVRMQGLPHGVGVKDVLGFFHGYQVMAGESAGHLATCGPPRSTKEWLCI